MNCGGLSLWASAAVINVAPTAAWHVERDIAPFVNNAEIVPMRFAAAWGIAIPPRHAVIVNAG
jgi:hypothetical protein